MKVNLRPRPISDTGTDCGGPPGPNVWMQRLATHLTAPGINNISRTRGMGDKDKKGKKTAARADAGAIDDIFAAPKSKGKRRADDGKEGKKAKVEDAAKRSAVKKVKKEKDEEKAEKGKERGEKKGKKEGKKEAKAERAVEEVVDPSVAVVAGLGRAKEDRAPGKRGRTEAEEDRLWRDSRGDVDRKLATLCRADSRQAHGGRILRVQGGRAWHRPRGGRHATLPVRLRLLYVPPLTTLTPGF